MRQARNFADQFAMLALFLGAALLALGLAAANGWLGNLNQDEGWYLYAALQWADGRLPYRDYFFTQGPLMPAIYGALAPLWRNYGVAGGRALTALLALVAALVTARLAGSAVPRERRHAAALTAFLLSACNVAHSYFTTIPKSYALASLLLMLGMLLLMRAQQRQRPWLAAVAALLLAMAAGTRLSLGAALPVAGIYLLCKGRSLPLAWLWFGLAGMAALALIFGLPLLYTWEGFAQANLFHTARAPGGLFLVVGSLSRLLRSYLPLAAVALAAITLMILGRRLGWRRGAAAADPVLQLWLPRFGAIFIVHLLAPYPYDDYQTPIMPLLAAVVAALLWRHLPMQRDKAREDALQRPLLALLLLWAAMTAAASQINQDWLIVRQDRFWVVKKSGSDLAKLRQVGRWIRERSAPDDLLLTQDTYLAVEARRRVPPGFEMGPFGYFPEMDSAKAARCHLLNRAALHALLAECKAPLAAFSGYGLAIAAPAMQPLAPAEQAALTELLQSNYQEIRTVPDFGQGHTSLKIWAKK